MTNDDEGVTKECEVPPCRKDATEFHDLAGETGVNVCEEHDGELSDFDACTTAILVLPNEEADPVEDTIWDRDIMTLWFCPRADELPDGHVRIRWECRELTQGEREGER